MIIVELLGFALLFFLILQANALTFQKTIEYYSLSMLLIAMGYILLYPKFFFLKTLKVDFNLLKLGLPFTLLAITGFLQSKVDLYVLNFYRDKATLGNYQIISGLFVFSQSIAGIIALPYIKNIFRMSATAIIKIKNLLKWFGLIGSIITTIAIYFVLKIYEIELSLKGYVFGFFISFLCYLYTIDLYVLLKQNKEFTIVKISTLCLIINLLLSILFLSLGMNLEGVLLANAICQFIAVLSYKYYSLNKIDS
jgi:O-antigen/teichoic acid export membrane protein